MTARRLEESGGVPYPHAKALRLYQATKLVVVLAAAAIVISIYGYSTGRVEGRLDTGIMFAMVSLLLLGHMAQVAINLTRRLDQLEHLISRNGDAAEQSAPPDAAARRG